LKLKQKIVIFFIILHKNDRFPRFGQVVDHLSK
jgi:hypothetical protein